MRVCFIVSEYFRWGAYGGYGTITRSVAEGLVDRGHEVSALVPRRTQEAKRSQPDVEVVDGVTVFALPHSYLKRISSRGTYRKPAAEVFVSTDARFDSWMAMRMNPDSAHCIWLIDPMTFSDYWERHADRATNGWRRSRTASQLVFNGLDAFGRRAIAQADLVTSQTKYMAEHGAEFFGLDFSPRFAPNPIRLPAGPVDKAETPSVLFLGRFDRQKQPERFFDLAAAFPEVRFVAAGQASDPDRDRDLRRKYSEIDNLEMPGLVTGEAKDRLLRESWILCNTSLREGLPRSFQEALAYECALLAEVDPDGLVSRYGTRVRDGRFDLGLNELLADNQWREKGRAGRLYLSETNERERALDVHEEIYEELTNVRS